MKDHLGSASVLTDSAGNLVTGADERYYPFGEKRLNGNMQTDKLFTGQREITGLGIYHFGARFYSPKLGRFLSADTIVPGYANLQNLNRFSYVNNNPLRYIDPTGHMMQVDDGGGCSPCTFLKPPSLSNHRHGGDVDPDFGVVLPPAPVIEVPSSNTDSSGSSNQDDTGCVNFTNQEVGCVPYGSVAVGLDAPAIMILAGAGLSAIGQPEAGLPIALAGVAFEKCAFTATPLCAAVKLASVNISLTVDGYGNLYVGPQISWGKSVLPFIALSDYFGMVSSENEHIPTEAEVRDTLGGFSVSAGTIATGGISYSPLATTYNTTYYLDGFPEIFSLNANYNVRVYDFSP